MILTASIINLALVITGILVLKITYFLYLTYNLTLSISNLTNDLGVILLAIFFRPQILPNYHDLNFEVEVMAEENENMNLNCEYYIVMTKQFTTNDTLEGISDYNIELKQLAIEKVPILILCPDDKMSRFMISISGIPDLS